MPGHLHHHDSWIVKAAMTIRCIDLHWDEMAWALEDFGKVWHVVLLVDITVQHQSLQQS
jgi:hypothetical protein